MDWGNIGELKWENTLLEDQKHSQTKLKYYGNVKA